MRNPANRIPCGDPAAASRSSGRFARALIAGAAACLLAAVGSAPAAAAPSSVPGAGLVTNGPVYSTARSGSTLYLGGAFTQVGPQTGPGVGLDASSGTVASLPPVSGANATVSAVIPDGAGGWYIGGSFSHVGTVARSALAHIESDGSVDTSMPQASGSNGSAFPTVKTLLLSGGTLYVGGDFTFLGGLSRTDLAAVDTATGTVSPTWNPHPNAAFIFTLTVNALALSGSDLYVGGVFSSIGGAARSNIAALAADPSGSGSASSWNPQATFANGVSSPVVSALLLSGSTLYVGGSFDTIGANVLARHNLAALNTATGNASSTWNPSVGDGSSQAAGTVDALALSGTALYLGGSFPTVGGLSHPGLAAVAADPTGSGSPLGGWNASGAISNLGAQAPLSPAVSALAVAGSTLYVGGNFTTIGANSAARSDLAALSADADVGGTGAATSWNPNANNPVLALATSGSTVYAGGQMTSVGGVTRHNLAAINTSTQQVLPFDPDAETTSSGAYAGAAPAVRALAVSGTTLYAGGQFDQVGANQQARTALAALDTTTSNATSFNAAVTGSVQNPPVVDSLLASGGALYVGGSFVTIGANAQPRSALAALDPATANASATWDPAASAPSGGGSAQPAAVYALALSGSTLYAGGYFTAIGGQPRDGVAALSADPSGAATATSWDPAPETGDPGSSATVYALALSGSTVYVGGSFGTMGHQQRGSLAAVDVVSGNAGAWAPDARGGAVYALAVSGSTVYIGGSFHGVGRLRSVARNNLAAVDAYSGDPTSWDPNATGSLGAPGASPAGVVDALSLSGSTVTVGDAFPTYDLGPASGVASFDDSSPIASVAPGVSPGGSPTQGDSLTATPATWSGSPSTFSHQWLRCDVTGDNCAAISGQTGTSHTVSGADVGSTLRVQEVAIGAGGTSDPATSPATSVVQALPGAPVNSAAPTISGEVASGQTLTADPGSWSGSNLNYSYQWERCDPAGTDCQPVANQILSTYALTTTDDGDAIRVAVSATNPATGDTSAPVLSAPTSAVPAVPVATNPPKISGNPQQGQTLIESHGSWSGSPTGYTYQWLRCSAAAGCAVITGATSQTYALGASDVGFSIEVSETASNPAGNGNASVSDPTAVVQGPPGSPVSAVPPTLSGSALAGQTLTEGHGSWTNLPSGYTYQWLRCGNGICAAITGATNQTYTIANADIGFTIEVSERAFNNNGAGAPAASAPSEVVAAPPTSPPLSTAPPSEQGIAQQGQTLTESHGTWTNSPTSFTYSWQRCDSGGVNCTPISGATAASYTLVPADVGATIVVAETATNTFGTSSPATSPPSAVVSAPPLAATAPPTISGTPQQGQTLTEANGTWTNNPTGFSYQWQQCDAAGAGCTAIAGATAQIYQAVAADVGHRLRVQEWATNNNGTAGPAISSATAVVIPTAPTSTALPTISGTPQQGQTLTEVHGSWTGNPTAFSYHWQQCDSAGAGCTAIAGATAATYVPVAGDIGHRLRVQESATNAGGTGGPATSGASAAVLPPPPANTAAPTVSGVDQQGQTLTESPGTWSGAPSGFSYQWQQCDASGANCNDVSGATGSTYVLGSADVGSRMRVEEFASNAGGLSAPAPSAVTAAVIPLAPASTSPPTVSGVDRQGQTLTEARGGWTNNPTGYLTQWQRCDTNGASCSAIAGATGQTYTLTVADPGHTIEVSETASNAGGSAGPVSSLPTGVIVPLAPVNTTPPGIVGSAQQGRTLNETHGTWANAPTSFSYQWQRCDTAGGACASIAGATAATYAATSADVGATLRVQEWATNASATVGPATSAASPAVAPPPPSSTSPPTVTGPAQDGQTLTESHGAWTNGPTSYTYAWLRCDSAGAGCAPISGASGATYTLADADVGHMIAASEAAANAGGAGTPATSAVTAIVAAPAPPAATAPPTISGVFQAGQALTEQHGSWSNAPSAFAYQWMRCDVAGANCVPIAGATDPTYALGSDDVGATLRVQESATNPGGSSTPSDSDATPAVAPAPVVSGTAPGAGSAGGGGGAGGAGGGSGAGGASPTSAITVPALTQTGPARVAGSGAALTLDGGLQVACPTGDPACSVTLVLTTPAAAPRAKGARHRRRASTVTLGRTQVMVPAGQHRELTLRLSRSGAGMLTAKHHLRATLQVIATAAALPPVTANRALTLSSPRRARRHH